MFKRKNIEEKEQVGVAEQLPLHLETADESISLTYPSDVVESLRYMLTRLGKTRPLPSRLTFVSTLREEGTTYLSRALGTTIAHDLDASVCVIELNWYWPALDGPYFNGNSGLSAVLQREKLLDEVLVATNWPNMFILPAGRLSAEDRPILTRSEILKQTIDELANKFDHLILDIPAILSTSDAIPLASLGDAACLVIRHGITPVEKVRQALDEINHLPIIGTVINRFDSHIPERILRFIPQDK